MASTKVLTDISYIEYVLSIRLLFLILCSVDRPAVREILFIQLIGGAGFPKILLTLLQNLCYYFSVQLPELLSQPGQ